MKKKATFIVALACALCLGMFVLSGCSSSGSDSGSTDSSSSTESSNAGTLSDGIFRVGFDQDFPPYGYVDEETGEYTGFDLDLAAEVCNRNGWTIKYVPINWDSKDLELESGTIDCIWNGFTIEGREDGYTFTDPYMDNSQVIVTRTDSGINSLSDLSGKTVEVQADSAAAALLSEDGDQAELASTFGSIQTIGEYNTAFMDLESGACDAIAIDLPVAKFNTQDKTDTFKILDEQLSSEHYGVGFKKGNTELRDKVQDTLIEMVNDGTVETICEKYADQGISYDQWILGK
ncbi:MAG: amino acid ABC transporter substrate-binding protein [Coriobacteriales bacterium]|jgi:polar amino acid transport system substrate-binding protein